MNRRHRITASAILLGSLIASSALPWSIPVPPDQEPTIEEWVEILLDGAARERIVSGFEYAKHFLPHVRRRVADRDLPEELVYLPVIESGYNPFATSPSGAAGIWQFMINTTAEYGLAVGESVDERRDFWKSTEAALDKLAHDYRRFGTWELALAAYHCGPNCVRRAIEATGSTDYWTISALGGFPSATIAYVPKLLALVRIVEQADSVGYGAWKAYDYEWVRVEVTNPVHLKLLADEAAVDFELLRFWNADLRFNATPHSADSGGKPYFLKVPVAYADTISRSILSREVQMTDYLVHRIRPGDTLSSLASKYGVSLHTITMYNPGLEPRFLQINTGIIIPQHDRRVSLSNAASR